MYFVVQDHGSEDLEPEFQFDMALNGSQVTEDNISVNGSLISGSEHDTSMSRWPFPRKISQPRRQKYHLSTQNLWARRWLSAMEPRSRCRSRLMTCIPTPRSPNRFIKTSKAMMSNGLRCTGWSYLAACRGLVAPEGAVAAGGEFILDENGVCQWEAVVL